nr:hypothetical protein [Peribacillus butanolivorans]
MNKELISVKKPFLKHNFGGNIVYIAAYRYFSDMALNAIPIPPEAKPVTPAKTF